MFVHTEIRIWRIKVTQLCSWILLFLVLSSARIADGEDIRVVNAIPNNFSNETTHQTEPSIAVNRKSGMQDRMVIASFGSLPAPAPQDERSPFNPYFMTLDGGVTWENIDNIRYGDTTVEWSEKGNAYAARLFDSRADGSYKDSMQVMATSLLDAAPDDRRTFSPVYTYTTPNRNKPDQPWLEVITKDGVDRCYVTFNDNSRDLASWAPGGDGKTASLRYSKDCSANRPTWKEFVLEDVAPASGSSNGVEVRASASGDRVYAAFKRSVENYQQSIVIRVDNNGGDNNFALTRIAREDYEPVTYQGHYENLNAWRPGGLSLAADPANAQRAFVSFPEQACCNPVLKLLRTVDGGNDWEDTAFDPRSFVPQERRYVGADLPALAYSTSGSTSCVGLLYTLFHDRQQADGLDVQAETHLARSCDGFQAANTIVDTTIARFRALDDERRPLHSGSPYIADYQDLEGVGDKFYGTFSMWNDPSKPENFPLGVTYKRRVECEEGQTMPHSSCHLEDEFDGGVDLSVDPFFFRANAIPEPSILSGICVGVLMLGRRQRRMR